MGATRARNSPAALRFSSRTFVTGADKMIGDALAALIGRSIDRRDGEGGTLGAAAGVAVWEVAKRVVPAALFVGGAALGARYLARKMQSDQG
jgi:hypothetical protein